MSDEEESVESKINDTLLEATYGTRAVTFAKDKLRANRNKTQEMLLRRSQELKEQYKSTLDKIKDRSKLLWGIAIGVSYFVFGLGVVVLALMVYKIINNDENTKIWPLVFAIGVLLSIAFVSFYSGRYIGIL